MKTDSQLHADILDELVYEPTLGSYELDVVVKDGIVTLSGVVDNDAELIAAEEAVKRVREIKGLAEEVTIVHPIYWKGHIVVQHVPEAVEEPRTTVYSAVRSTVFLILAGVSAGIGLDLLYQLFKAFFK